MQISSRFTIAVHMLTAVEVFKDDYKVTSDFLAGSVNTNPVIIRKIMGQLKETGLIEVARGTGGITLTRPLEDITLLDIYRAVEPTADEGLFHFHENPNPQCPVGRNIHGLLDGHLEDAEKAMEDSLASVTLADLVADAKERI